MVSLLRVATERNPFERRESAHVLHEMLGKSSDKVKVVFRYIIRDSPDVGQLRRVQNSEEVVGKARWVTKPHWMIPNPPRLRSVDNSGGGAVEQRRPFGTNLVADGIQGLSSGRHFLVVAFRLYPCSVLGFRNLVGFDCLQHTLPRRQIEARGGVCLGSEETAVDVHSDLRGQVEEWRACLSRSFILSGS